MSLAIVISLLASFSAISHAGMQTMDHDPAQSMYSSQSQSLKSEQADATKIVKSAKGCEQSNMMGDDSGSCCKSFCASYYLTNFSSFDQSIQGSTYELQLFRAVLENRLSAPHRPPNT